MEATVATVAKEDMVEIATMAVVAMGATDVETTVLLRRGAMSSLLHRTQFPFSVELDFPMAPLTLILSFLKPASGENSLKLVSVQVF